MAAALMLVGTPASVLTSRLAGRPDVRPRWPNRAHRNRGLPVKPVRIALPDITVAPTVGVTSRRDSAWRCGDGSGAEQGSEARSENAFGASFRGLVQGLVRGCARRPKWA